MVGEGIGYLFAATTSEASTDTAAASTVKKQLNVQ